MPGETGKTRGGYNANTACPPSLNTDRMPCPTDNGAGYGMAMRTGTVVNVNGGES